MSSMTWLVGAARRPTRAVRGGAVMCLEPWRLRTAQACRLCAGKQLYQMHAQRVGFVVGGGGGRQGGRIFSLQAWPWKTAEVCARKGGVGEHHEGCRRPRVASLACSGQLYGLCARTCRLFRFSFGGWWGGWGHLVEHECRVLSRLAGLALEGQLEQVCAHARSLPPGLHDQQAGHVRLLRVTIVRAQAVDGGLRNMPSVSSRCGPVGGCVTRADTPPAAGALARGGLCGAKGVQTETQLRWQQSSPTNSNADASVQHPGVIHAAA